MKRVVFLLIGSVIQASAAHLRSVANKGRKRGKITSRVELKPSPSRKSFLAASLLLVMSTQQFTQVRAYAQSFEQPATVVTVPQSVSLDGGGMAAQTVAGIGAGAVQSIVATGDSPTGTSKDSQSGGQAQAPQVPPAPDMAQINMVQGLVPVVEAVVLTPPVPSLPGSDSAGSLGSTPVADASAVAPVPSVTTASDGAGASSAVTSSSQPQLNASAGSPDLVSPSIADASAVAPVASVTTASGPSPETSTSNPKPLQGADSIAQPEAGNISVTVGSTPSGDPPNSIATITSASGNLFSAGTNLDLTSSVDTLQAPLTQPVFITVGGSLGSTGEVVGGTQVQVNPGQLLSPAEYVAVTQVLQHGVQNIILTGDGSAQGGYFSLQAGHTGSLGGLVLPQNVVLDTVGFTAASPFSVTGATSILGTLYAMQSDGGVSSVLNFGNLTVTGVLTGDASSRALTSPFLPNYFSSSGLTVSTAGFLQNYGTISSAGNLTINAGTSFFNAGNLSAASVNVNSFGNLVNTGSILATTGSVNFSGPSGDFVNSGIINSVLADVNFNTASAAEAANIALNNGHGQILAEQGNINFRSSSFDSKSNLAITGGSLSAKQINLNGGRGDVDVSVDNLGGTVNSSAHSVRLMSVNDITIGNTTANGDPTIVSTSGDITIAGNQITGGAPLSVIAYGNILTDPGISIQTSGGEVFMASGVNIQDGGAVWRITGPASPDGGFMDLRGISTFSTVGATGGNVTLVAYDGGNIDSGRIVFSPTTTIQTSGTAGANGNVTLIGEDANSANLNGIVTGAIDTRGAGNGIAGTGNVLLAAARLPDTVNVTVDKVSGAATGLNQFVQLGGLPRNISVTGDIITKGGSVTMVAGNATSANGNILVTGQVDNRISASGAGTGNGGSFTVIQNSANAFIVGGATINGIGSATRAIQNQAGTGGGNGGIVSITNNGAGGITANLGSVATPRINISAAGSGNGGSFILNAPNGPISLSTTGNAVNAQAAGANGNGGNIQIVGQSFTASGNPLLNVNGVGSGNGGTITVQSTQAGNNITVGNTSPDIRISASGGATGQAGTVNLNAGGNLTVNTAQLSASTGTNRNGATLNFNSGLGGAGTTQIIGSLNVDGNGTGSGGSINISTNSGSAFAVSGSGVSGTLSARSGAAGGNGGSINISNKGSGGITITNPSVISVAPLSSGKGGNIVLDATTGATPGVVTLASGTYSASGLGASGDGGTISVKGSQTVTSGAGPVILQADASGTGNGGTVQLIATAAGSSATIGNSSNQFIINTRGGSAGSAAGNGGTIEVRQGGNLAVSDTSFLNAAPIGTAGNGGSYILEAGTGGTGNLSVTGSLNAQGGGVGGAGNGKGGTVELISRSTSAFTVNSGASANGINGTVGASGGTAGGAGRDSDSSR
ncbi:MAG: hypothetical protein E6Q53_02695 [Candidatus Moraniibacteriota bacterium]|nr:MAG: hypothetical protein E6Q53_02695 [Candidatus Moranbacteria bacterium]